MSVIETGDIRRVSPVSAQRLRLDFNQTRQRVLFADNIKTNGGREEQKEEISLRESGEQRR